MIAPFVLLVSLPGQTTGGSPYDVDVAADLTATLALLGVDLIAEAAVKPSLQGGLSCVPAPGTDRCDPAKLNALDRTVVGNDSKAWRQYSDLAATATYIIPVAASFIDSWASKSQTPFADAATDVLVMAEAVAVATAFGQVLKFAVRRPRPTQYTTGAYIGSVEHQLSFPSGHTLSTAAAMTSYICTFFWRHPDSWWRFPVLLFGAAITATTGYGRIAGGWHFYTDVFAGALIGVAAGFLVPQLHRRNVQVVVLAGGGDPDTAEPQSRGLALRFSF